MKNINNLQNLILIAFVLLFTFSCSVKDIEPTSEYINYKGNIAFVAEQNSNLTTFVQALEITDLFFTLKNDGPYTVFAPSNTAFASFLATNGYATIDDVPVSTLKKVLQNHFVRTKLMSAQLVTGYVKSVATKTVSAVPYQYSLFINTTSGVLINGGSTNGGSKVITADINATNGVIHIIDNVMKLPTIVNHAVSNPNFSSLVSALTSAGQPNYIATLSGTTAYTVFAPTNSAFTSLNTELAPGGLASVSATDLTKVLNYHVVTGTTVASSLTQGLIINTLQTPQTVAIDLVGGAKIVDARSRVSNIIVTNLVCSNGVIHAIDKVLLPIF